jgi:hypothetical protein
VSPPVLVIQIEDADSTPDISIEGIYIEELCGVQTSGLSRNCQPQFGR